MSIALILLLALCVVIYCYFCSIPTVQGCGRSEICDSSQSIERIGYELTLYQMHNFGLPGTLFSHLILVVTKEFM